MTACTISKSKSRYRCTARLRNPTIFWSFSPKLGSRICSPHKDAEGLAALARNPQAFLSYQHVGQIERGFAGTNNVENRRILKQVIRFEVGACRRQGDSGLRDASLQRSDLLRDGFFAHAL